MNDILEHSRTQIAFLTLSKTCLAVLGQNITTFYIISTNQFCCSQTPSMSFFSLKNMRGKAFYELPNLTCEWPLAVAPAD